MTILPNESDAFDVLDRALRAAKGDAADAAFVASDHNISRFANSNLHQNMSEVSAGLTLRVVVDGSVGVASTSSFGDEEIARTADLAREAARLSPAGQRFELATSGGQLIDLPTFDEATARIAPMEKAQALRAMFDRGAQVGVHFAGTYSTSSAIVACANSHGIRRSATLTSAEATVIAIHPHGSGYATRCSRAASEIDVPALGDEATFKALLKNDVTADVEPGEFDVILEPPALAEVFEWLGMIAFSGQSYEDGSSFLVDRIGERVLGANVTIADDAADPSFMPFPFDIEGTAKRRVPLVERGVPRTPMVDQAYASRLGFAPNGGAWHLGSSDHGSPFHVSMEGGDATREELIASTRHGIWVTRFNYVNGLLEPKSALMTGTTRDGTFLIRDGEVVARLPNLRWTQSITEAFSRVEALTSERRKVGTWYNMFGGTIAPTVKIRGWNFTGKQQGV